MNFWLAWIVRIVRNLYGNCIEIFLIYENSENWVIAKIVLKLLKFWRGQKVEAIQDSQQNFCDFKC